MLGAAAICGLLSLQPGPDAKAEGPASPPEPKLENQEASRSGNALGFDPRSAPPVGDTPADLGLMREEDGGYLYVDPRKRFTARFEPDGTVQFADRWRRPSGSKPQRGRCCMLPAEGFAALNPLAGMGMTGPIEWLMAIQGHDPNSIAKKTILDQTRDLRIQLAIAYNLGLLDRRLRELPPELLRIWSDENMSRTRKRELLFERWDECEERFSVQPGDIPAEAVSEIDRIRVETAERARRKIEAFVRRHAPQRSRRGYPTHELESFNRRRVSEREFSPYTPAKR